MSSSTRLGSVVALRAWLDEHTWFVHAEPQELMLIPPTIGASRPGLRLVLTDVVRSSHVAGKLRTLRDYILFAEGVESYTDGEAAPFVVGHCSEGFEVEDSEHGIAFAIDVPGRLFVRCRALTIDALPERTDVVRAQPSDREVRAIMAGLDVPRPSEWLERFRSQGLEVCWRTYDGPAEAGPSRADQYSGWLLQLPARVPTTKAGLLFRSCRNQGAALEVHWERSGNDVTDELWRAARLVLAGFDGARVLNGNCEFSSKEWRLFCASGELPPRLGG